MSLSDKHEGKILVPWFCSQEWQYVYFLIYSETSNNSTKAEALQILKLWKTRQVLLSSGVEGTLIILGATLTDATYLDEEKLCLLYATSIMRFLNLCAANNKRQGTFYETARRNNLPDWLINIRHDLAHDQKIPSKFMLQHCLNYCLEWLKKEYWDAQYCMVRDFVALNKIQKKQDVKRYIVLYGDVVLEAVTKGIDRLEELTNDCVEKLYSWFKSSNFNASSKITYILLVLSKACVPAVAEKRRENIAEHVVEEIIRHGGIFEMPTEEEAQKGEKFIPINFLSFWFPLIQKLCENNMLLTLLKSLSTITTDENCDVRIREVAAVWLNTIFKILAESKLSQEQDNNSCNYYTIRFVLSNDHVLWGQLKTLQEEVLQSPNPLTLIFLDQLLSLNACSNSYIEGVKTLVKTYTQARHNRNTVAMVEVHTVNDLLKIFKDVEIEEIQNTSEGVLHNCSDKKWHLVEDPSVFAGCPLGVLPHQARTRNLLL